MADGGEPTGATVDVSFSADMGPVEDALRDLTELADRFGAQLTGALKSAVVGGKDLDDILRRIGLNLAGMALSRAWSPCSRWRDRCFPAWSARWRRHPRRRRPAAFAAERRGRRAELFSDRHGGSRPWRAGRWPAAGSAAAAAASGARSARRRASASCST